MVASIGLPARTTVEKMRTNLSNTELAHYPNLLRIPKSADKIYPAIDSRLLVGGQCSPSFPARTNPDSTLLRRNQCDSR